MKRAFETIQPIFAGMSKKSSESCLTAGEKGKTIDG